jgi:hypothetical protein
MAKQKLLSEKRTTGLAVIPVFSNMCHPTTRLKARKSGRRQFARPPRPRWWPDADDMEALAAIFTHRSSLTRYVIALRRFFSLPNPLFIEGSWE